jgi:hypothetical protein
MSSGIVFLQEGHIFPVEAAVNRLPQLPQKADTSGLSNPQVLHFFILAILL